LEEAQRALANLDGDLTTVQFNPNDPGSIEAAIQKVEQTIEERVGHYADNPFVAPLIEQAKEHFREAIIQKAAASRLGANDEERPDE
jgi:hypothetical protein